jgi:hypothetical protein
MWRGHIVPTKNGEALDSAVDDIDAGWEDEEQEEDLDAGWDAAEAAKTPEEREREWRGLTPEEREARTARAAARKEKLRAKAAEKAERRKTRASMARAKQKPKQKSQRPPRIEREPRESRRHQADTSVVRESLHDRGPESRARPRRNDPRVLAFLLAIVLVAGGVALFLWKR